MAPKNEKAAICIPRGEANDGLMPCFSLFYQPGGSSHPNFPKTRSCIFLCRLSPQKFEKREISIFRTFCAREWVEICENAALSCGVFRAASFINTFWCGQRDLNPYGCPHAPQTCASACSAMTAWIKLACLFYHTTLKNARAIPGVFQKEKVKQKMPCFFNKLFCVILCILGSTKRPPAKVPPVAYALSCYFRVIFVCYACVFLLNMNER